MTDLRVAALRRVSPKDAGIAFGTEYLVADRLILTAVHVAGVVGESLEVRLGVQLVTGTVIWRASGADDASSPPDAALIEIDAGTYPTADLPPVRWGGSSAAAPPSAALALAILMPWSRRMAAPMDRILILGERHLTLVLREYLIHYNGQATSIAAPTAPRISKRSRAGTWPTCDPSAENPSSRE